MRKFPPALVALILTFVPAAVRAGLDLSILPFGYIDKSSLTYESDALNYYASPVRWGYMDRSGKVLIQPGLEDAGFFNTEGLAPVKKNGAWSIVDKKGRTVREPQGGGYIEVLPNGYFKIRKDKKTSYLDPKGRAITEERFKTAPAVTENEGVVRSCKNRKGAGEGPGAYGYAIRGISHRNLPMVGLYRLSGERISRPVFSGIETVVVGDLIRFMLRDGETVYFLLCDGVFLRPRLKQHGTWKIR